MSLLTLLFASIVAPLIIGVIYAMLRQTELGTTDWGVKTKLSVFVMIGGSQIVAALKKLNVVELNTAMWLAIPLIGVGALASGFCIVNYQRAKKQNK